MIATRDSYGKALAEYGEAYKNLVVLDADLCEATKTCYFKEKFPERHIECGIAEANMMGAAAGLSLTGKIPFVSTFAMFAAGRAYEQIRNSIAYPHLNVKIGATHGGISVGEDGATHQCVEDFALMRAIPGMVVLNPADDLETRLAVRAALEYAGPVYLRFGRPKVPVLLRDGNYSFQIGKAVMMREGSDITIAATGICVGAALEAARRLEGQGISAEVIDVHTIKPLDQDMILKSASKTKKVVTVEEHSVIGGLGSAVSDCLSANLPVLTCKIGVPDCFGESGTAEELLAKYGLDADGIYRKVLEFHSF